MKLNLLKILFIFVLFISQSVSASQVLPSEDQITWAEFLIQNRIPYRLIRVTAQ